MDQPYRYQADLKGLVNVSPESIVSRSLLVNENVRVTLFAFDAGQELTEHTSSLPAIMEFIEGEADIALGGEKQEAKAGTWVYMAPQLPHSIVAKTPLVMLLTQIEAARK